jgi:hypothetical protein
MEDKKFGLSDNQIRELFDLDEDHLLSNISTARGRGARGIDSVREGKRIFKNSKRLLQKKICESSKVQNAYQVSLDTGVSLVLLASLVDIVSGLLTGFAGASFCVLLIKEGLPEYCLDIWEENNEI